MPLMPQRTILRLPDRSLLWAVNKRGMGQAPCPSMQQLQGIADINDPCQNPSSGPMIPPGQTAAVSQPQWSSIVSNLFSAPGVPSSAGGVTTPGINLPSWVMPVGVGLTALVVLNLFSGGRR